MEVKVWDHVAEFSDMAREMLVGGNLLQTLESGAREARGDARILVNGAELGKALADEAEVADNLGQIGRRMGRQLEAFLREICSSVKTDQFVRIGLDEVEDVSKQFVRQVQDARGRRSHAGDG